MATVTLLFTDLVGSTDLLTRLGEERGEVVRRTHFQLLRDAVAEGGGQEVKNLGDGLMVVFASALDAVRCAVGMQRAVHSHNQRLGAEPLWVRIGVHIGETVQEGADYFGSAVVLAKRLCDLAQGGQILTSDVVRAVLGGRAGDHEFRSVGRVSLKGIGEEVEACEVTWEPDSPRVPLPPALGGAPSALIGRADDLAQLEAAFATAKGGTRALALVAGEPGIGKTALVLDFARRAFDEHGATVLYGRCDEGPMAPYQPFIEAIAHFVTEASDAELMAAIGPSAHELARVVPALSTRLPHLPEPLRAEPDTERIRLMDAAAEFLDAASLRAPIVLVLDDLHWADAPSLVLLKHVARAQAPSAVLVVATYRDVEVDRRHPLSQVLVDLRRSANVDRVLLRGLARHDVVELVQARAGSTLDSPGMSLAHALHVETEGNPFFIGEILRHLVETGAIHQEEGRWTSHLALDQIGLPESVRDVIGRRLSRLSDACNDVLRVAAVIGRSFDLPVLGQVVDTEELRLVDALDEATRARVVLETPGEFDRYEFAHMLIQETLYEELTTSRRVRLHQRIGLVLEKQYQAALDEHLPELAHHFREAALVGEVDRAVDYGVRAGDAAMAVTAYEEAVAHYDRVLQALELAAGEPDGTRVELLLRQGEALMAIGDTAGGRARFAAAARHAATEGDADGLARAALGHGGLWAEIAGLDPDVRPLLESALAALSAGDSDLHSRILSRLGMELAFTSENERVDAITAESLDMARRLGDPTAVAYAAIARRHIVTGPGQIDERLALTREAVTIADSVNDGAMAVRARALLAADAAEVGDLVTWRECTETICRIAQELRQPRYEYLAELMNSSFAHRGGQYDVAEAHALRAREIAQSIGRMTGLIATGNILTAIKSQRDGPAVAAAEVEPVAELLRSAFPIFGVVWTMLAAESGRVDEARADLDALLDGPLRDPRDDWTFWAVCSFPTMAAARADHVRAAARLYELLSPFAGRHMIGAGTGLTAYISPVSTALGMLAGVLRRFEDAERHFAAGRRDAESIDAPAAAALGDFEHALVLRRRSAAGDRDRALTLLDGILATARQLRMPSLVTRASAEREHWL